MSDTPVLLAGGEVIDGTGSAPRFADVLIRGDRIAGVGERLEEPEGTRVIDVTGCTVTPGFVDLHSHADMTVLAFPSADSALRQGITTIVTGNCGGGVAPLTARHHVTDVAFAYDSSWGIDVDWSTFGEYAAHLDGAGVNVAPLVAHGAIRNAAIGLAPRASTEPEQRLMSSILDEALDAGAFGMSSGLEYQPGIWAQADEMRALVARVGSRERLYATHIRGRAAGYSNATEEALRTTERTGARLQLSHFAPRPNAPIAARERAFEQVQLAAEGTPGMIGIDTFPEMWGPALLIDLFPAWVFEGPTHQVLERLADPACRRRITAHFDSTPGFLAQIAGYESIYLSDTPAGRARSGQPVSEIATDLGCTVADACCALLAEAGDRFRSVAIRHVYATEPDLTRTMALPYCSIASDGVVTSGEGEDCPLTWNSSTYGYVARTIERYVREVGLYSMPDAVRRMTSLPAWQVGLAGRGAISVGSFADIVVLDPERVHDRSTPDDMARHPAGIQHVLVNGQFAVDAGAVQPARHGRRLLPR